VAEIHIDPAKAFELPEDAARHYSLVNPFPDQKLDITQLRAGEATTFKLQPFEVLIVEALPDGS
jgi:hypothetical protein